MSASVYDVHGLTHHYRKTQNERADSVMTMSSPTDDDVDSGVYTSDSFAACSRRGFHGTQILLANSVQQRSSCTLLK